MPISLDLMPLEEKAPEAPPPKTIVVRYGYLKEIGEFPSDITSKVGCGTKLIIRSDRGTEIGEMLTTICGNGGCNKSITREKLVSYIENSGARNYPFSEQGRILRVATVQDLAEQAKLDENRHKHLTMARELVATHRLQMKIVDVEHVLGGERVLFYFVSEHRVDFRSLVRDLAHSLHTRIELRQVGARDEARLTADYEKCGQHCCCKQFLKVLTPISMRSAKVQKATLDPTKISGRCGRLMCCLRYEDETYEELRKKLPKRNTRVQTAAGDGWVLDGQILTQLVLVQYDDGKREAVPMEKIVAFDRPKPVLPDGRTMQTPNDRPPPAAFEPRGRGGPPGGPAGGPPQRRPMPGAPARGPQGDPLSTTGPTGGDLTGASAAGAGEEIDDLIADAFDGAMPPGLPPVEEHSDDPRAEMPPPAPMRPPQVNPPQGNPPRPGGPSQGQGFHAGPRPQGPRGPQNKPGRQSFRPPPPRQIPKAPPQGGPPSPPQGQQNSPQESSPNPPPQEPPPAPPAEGQGSPPEGL